MPELPDLTAYLEAIAERALGQPLGRVDIVKPFVLRTVEPPPAEVEGRALRALERIGKRIVFVLDGDRFVVLHLMIAGRLLWKAPGAKSPGRIASAALHFGNGTLWLTEAATKKRAAIHLVRGREALAAHDPGGIEPLAADAATFRRAITRENRTLKRALTDPRIVAGIGNAYSDEILHAARLSPFLRTGELSGEAFTALHEATREVLESWIERLRRERAGGFPAHVTAFRPDMAVHGRFGKPCPRCGGAVQRVVYAENEANYCPACQTGGRLLADRALSRLLQGDWPKTLEELEERKERSRAAGAAGPGVSLLLAAALLVPAFAGGDAKPDPRPRQDVELALPLPAREADPARLDRARRLLGERARVATLGPFPLLTDVEGAALLERAAGLAASFDATYRARYGLVPVGVPRETVVLFAREPDYRAYQSGEPGLAEVAGASGLAGGGIAATFVGGRTDDEVLGTLAHEWAHLASRRALGPALPSWLDEGIAEELGGARIDGQGRLLPGTWSRVLAERSDGWTMSGGEAALRELFDRLGRPLTGAADRAAEAAGPTPAADAVATVFALDWRAFAAESDAPFHYALASTFLRFLFDDAALAGPARQWMAEVAGGAPPEIEALRDALGASWSELERQLRRYVETEMKALPPLPGGTGMTTD